VAIVAKQTALASFMKATVPLLQLTMDLPDELVKPNLCIVENTGTLLAKAPK
jgi:hypothetical protein